MTRSQLRKKVFAVLNARPDGLTKAGLNEATGAAGNVIDCLRLGTELANLIRIGAVIDDLGRGAAGPTYRLSNAPPTTLPETPTDAPVRAEPARAEVQLPEADPRPAPGAPARHRGGPRVLARAVAPAAEAPPQAVQSAPGPDGTGPDDPAPRPDGVVADGTPGRVTWAYGGRPLARPSGRPNPRCLECGAPIEGTPALISGALTFHVPCLLERNRRARARREAS